MSPPIARSNRADRPKPLDLGCLAHEQYRAALLKVEPPVYCVIGHFSVDQGVLDALLELDIYNSHFTSKAKEWALGLQDTVTRSNVVDGADRLQQAAVRMHEMARRVDILSNNWNADNFNNGGGFNDAGYGYDNARGRDNGFPRDGFNGGGRGFQAADGNNGQPFFNVAAQDGFNGDFHPGVGGEVFDNHNKRRTEFRPSRGNGRFPARGNDRGRSREHYAEIQKINNKPVLTVVAGAVSKPVSDADISKAVTNAISVVAEQKGTKVASTPMLVTMDPVAPLAASTVGSAVVATKPNDKLGQKKSKKKEKNVDKIALFIFLLSRS
ncbi:hypothetical protein ACQ4PT_055998 [Festuca glaucescens]